MKLPKQAIVASSMLFAVTGFAQMSLPRPAAPQPAIGTGVAPEVAPPSAGATQRSGASAHAAPSASSARERTATTPEGDNKAEAEARNRMDAQKRALAPSAGVGARMETDMAVRR